MTTVAALKDASKACADTDPEVFFPDLQPLSPKARARAVEQAKSICRGCPLLEPCLTYALTHHEAGIWGGTTEKERVSIKRRAADRRRGVAQRRKAADAAAWQVRKERERVARQNPERDRTIRVRTSQGQAAAEIARQVGVTPRTVHRARARNREDAQ